jgi:hypothetical protein
MAAVACCDVLLRYFDMDLSEEDLAVVLAILPRKAIEELSHGPWPEPYCGFCRSLEAAESEMTDAQKYIAACLVEWHDEPMRDPAKTKREGDKETYERCQRTYAAAKRVLEAVHT